MSWYRIHTAFVLLLSVLPTRRVSVRFADGFFAVAVIKKCNMTIAFPWRVHRVDSLVY
jgi:hypothetical protein